MRIVFVEKSSLSPEETVYVESESSVVKVAGVGGAEQRQRWLDKARAWFTAVFLPEGFPATVSSDYLSYQLWDTVQAFASSISGSLATAAVLTGATSGVLFIFYSLAHSL